MDIIKNILFDLFHLKIGTWCSVPCIPDSDSTIKPDEETIVYFCRFVLFIRVILGTKVLQRSRRDKKGHDYSYITNSQEALKNLKKTSIISSSRYKDSILFSYSFLKSKFHCLIQTICGHFICLFRLWGIFSLSFYFNFWHHRVHG